MNHVHPFRAWHFHPDKIAIHKTIAPPYDVISEEMEAELHKRDPYNIIRLELGKAKPKDLENQKRYETAKHFLNDWIEKDVLTHESRPGFYLYEMIFKHPFQNKKLSRLAVFALLKLESFDKKIIFPHEKTHASPKVDRMNLLKATQSNFSPVFTIFEDTSKVLDEVKANCESDDPLYDFKDDQGIEHKLWFVHSEKDINRISKMFDQKRLFIADGHHRYSTALAYSQEMNNQFLGESNPGWNYVLSTFVRFNDPGLLILPIHRVITKALPETKEKFLEALNKHFVLHPASRQVLEKISEGSAKEGFGLTFSETESYLLELKDKASAKQNMPQGKPNTWYELDMNVIFYLILEPLFKIKESEQEWNIFYTPSLQEVFQKFEGTPHEASCAFIVRPVTAKTIKDICETGELMPQKSTYFYPKFPSGVLIHRH